MKKMKELEFDRLTKNENGKAVQAARAVLVYGQAKTVAGRTHGVSVPAIDTVLNRIAMRVTQEHLERCRAKLRELGVNDD